MCVAKYTVVVTIHSYYEYTLLNAELPWMTLMVYILCTSFCFCFSDLVWRDWEQFGSKLYYSIKTQTWFLGVYIWHRKKTHYHFGSWEYVILNQKKTSSIAKQVHQRTNMDTPKSNRKSILLVGSCMVNLAHACSLPTVLCLFVTKPTSWLAHLH